MTRPEKAADFRRSDRTHLSSLRIEYFPEPSNGGKIQRTARSRTRPATGAAMKEVASNVRFPSIRYQSGDGTSHNRFGLVSCSTASTDTKSLRWKRVYMTSRCG